jgi:hypothetical protein
VELLPHDVQNRRVLFRPVPLEGVAAARALATIVEQSKRRGAHLTVDAGRAVLDLPEER